MAAGDIVDLQVKHRPEDYHCKCEYCSRPIGELRPLDNRGRPTGAYYSRLERRQYYCAGEKGGKGHVAKTPLHVARWAIQAYTRQGDWVLDPTIGAGTTAIEAITQRRNVAGMELQFEDVLLANIKKNLPAGVQAEIQIGDARGIGNFLKKIDKRFQLIVNNPPYSGDEHWTTLNVPEGSKHRSTTFDYGANLPNIAFLKEGTDYWQVMEMIYRECSYWLLPGGYFVTGIKDMMRKKAPFTLHRDFCGVLTTIGLEFVGTAFLRHYPGTLFTNTYEGLYGVKPPLYQTISVFRKKGGRRK